MFFWPYGAVKGGRMRGLNPFVTGVPQRPVCDSDTHNVDTQIRRHPTHKTQWSISKITKSPRDSSEHPEWRHTRWEQERSTKWQHARLCFNRLTDVSKGTWVFLRKETRSPEVNTEETFSTSTHWRSLQRNWEDRRPDKGIGRETHRHPGSTKWHHPLNEEQSKRLQKG